jgi:uncharacterized membrane protein YphA (DoxX/SURF4 family)
MQTLTSHRHDSASLSRTYWILRITYGLVPFLAGLDKFFNLLTNWEKYLPAGVAQMLPVSPGLFMGVVGVIEMLAGLAVLTVLPRIGPLVVMIWLVLVGLSAGLAGYFDITVRDLVMAVGAYTLAQLAVRQEPSADEPLDPRQTVRQHA